MSNTKGFASGGHYLHPEFDGAKLRRYRLDEGWTQRELGRRAGVTDPQIAQWEQGHCMPTDGNINALAQALGISRAALLDHTEELFEE